MTDSTAVLDRALDVLFGSSGSEPLPIAPEEIYVDAVMLPTRNLSEARAAAALQLDRLCPIDPSSACFELLAVDEAGSGPHGQFVLAVVSQTALDSARDEAAGPCEAFSAEVEHDGLLHLFVFRDSAARSARRRRRLMTLAAGAALLASVVWSAGESRNLAERVHSAEVAAVAQAQSYLEQLRQQGQRLRATQAELSAGRTDDVAARFIRTLAALSDPPVEGLSIMALSVDMNDATITGSTADPELVRTGLSDRAGIVVTSFNAGPVAPAQTGQTSVEIHLSSPGASP